MKEQRPRPYVSFRDDVKSAIEGTIAYYQRKSKLTAHVGGIKTWSMSFDDPIRLSPDFICLATLIRASRLRQKQENVILTGLAVSQLSDQLGMYALVDRRRESAIVSETYGFEVVLHSREEAFFWVAQEGETEIYRVYLSRVGKDRRETFTTAWDDMKRLFGGIRENFK